MPALARAREEARKAVCKANVHNLGIGWQMFKKDHDGKWTREAEQMYSGGPSSLADITGLGYLEDMDVYICPSLDTPYSREPELLFDTSDTGDEIYNGHIREISYAADEGRIAKDSLAGRAIMADGIECLTEYGMEPANHATQGGRAAGANVLALDMSVQWVGTFFPSRQWVLDHWANSPLDDDNDLLPEDVDAYGFGGWAGNSPWWPVTTSGTWRRYGYIQNLRLLRALPDLDNGGVGQGEDDQENVMQAQINVGGAASPVPLGGHDIIDVDDIYYIDPSTDSLCAPGITAGSIYDHIPWGFVTVDRHCRVTQQQSKSPKDCSLSMGDIWDWRGNYQGGWDTDDDVDADVPDEYSGTECWGWPDEYVELVEGG
jgi:hypothetical protein